VHALRAELTPRTEATNTRGSLKGIWGDMRIDEGLITEAKNSLFPYEKRRE
jgi:hypothetical protein